MSARRWPRFPNPAEMRPCFMAKHKIHKTVLMDKQQIIANEKKLLDAMKNSNVQKLDELLHEGLLFNIPNGQTITKDMDLEAYRSGNMKIDKISSSGQEIQLIGDNAVVAVTIEMKGKYFDQIIDGKYRIFRVWKLCGDNWKVLAGSSARL